MKRKIVTLIFAILLGSNVNAIDNNVLQIIHIIEEINIFEDNELNKLLGNDLINYHYEYYILNEIPTLTENDLNDIKWQYFIRSSDELVSFRIILNGKNETIMANEDNIKRFFNSKIVKLLDHREKNNDLYLEGLGIARKYFEFIDNDKYEEFYQFFSNDLKLIISANDLIEKFRDRDKNFGVLKERNSHSSVYYENLPSEYNTPDFYAFSFISKSENIEQFIETISLIYFEGEWKIMGFNIV